MWLQPVDYSDEQLHGRLLGAVLKARKKDADFSAEHIATLEAARAGRNYLAHRAAEAALYVPASTGKRKLREILGGTADPAAIEKERAEMLLAHIRKALPAFEEAIRALAEADTGGPCQLGMAAFIVSSPEM